MKFDPHFAASILPGILRASLVTVEIFLASGFLAIVGGFILALGKRGPKPVSIAVEALVACVRLSPFLAQLYFFYYVLPAYGVTLPAIWIGIIALSVSFGCYLSRVFGAGFDSIAKGQLEAATALGMSPLQITFLILLPQMLRVVSAPTAGYMILLFKTVPYVAIIGVRDMLGAAFEQASNTFRYVEPLSDVGALFLIYCLFIAFSLRKLESQLERSVRR
jgi:polar amino acid transport system permease protein